MSSSVTLWTIAHQTPLPMRFLRQEYRSGWPFPSPGYLPSPGISLLHLLHQQVVSLPLVLPVKSLKKRGSYFVFFNICLTKKIAKLFFKSRIMDILVQNHFMFKLLTITKLMSKIQKSIDIYFPPATLGNILTEKSHLICQVCLKREESTGT